LAKGELEKGKQDAAPVVKGLRLGVAAVAVSSEGVTGELRRCFAGKPLFEVFAADADALELALGQHAVGVLSCLGFEVDRDGVSQDDLAFGGAVVGERVIEVELKRLGRAGQTAESGLGIMEQLVGQTGGGAADAGIGLSRLNI
jgi:hypothetical protein